MLVIAHVSDLHFDGGDMAASRARRVLDYVAALPEPVDALLVSGDIADHGLPSEYEEAAKLLAGSPVPVLLLPGNHDARGPFRAGLLNLPSSDEPINQVQKIGGALFALCDSSIPGRPDGLLADETIDWLDSVLVDDLPAFICFHHPPVPLHVRIVDEIRQYGEDRLAAVVARHPSVVALLCGHAHTAAATVFAGRPLLVAPGVASTLRLPWEQEGVVDPAQPPGLAFHVLSDDLRLVTHYRVA